MTFTEELEWRGFINQTTYKDLNVLNDNPVTFYWGVDPSADSMTIGNLAAAMMVKCFIKNGHKPILLIGGATGLIGDPDGKAEERQLLSRDDIASNKQAIAAQYKAIFSGHHFEIVDNYDWFKDINYLDFLRNTGKHVPMRQMLGREFVETRLSENGAGISYAEFSYVLIQAYDFLWLNQNRGVTLQVAGSDQWGNSIAGVDLIRRVASSEAHVYSTPLIIDEATGRKFGKSEDGAIWLDPAKTTPTKFYQFWINTNDEVVEKYLKIFTELNSYQVSNMMTTHNANPAARLAQIELATAVTALVHGEEATITARAVTDILTGRTNLAEVNEDYLISSLRKEIPFVSVEPNSEITEALVVAGLASSKTEARKLIGANAISINGNKVQRDNFEDSDFSNGRLLLRRGKAFKDSALVEL
jgi:tyrosyl-tRNA synthetase